MDRYRVEGLGFGVMGFKFSLVILGLGVGALGFGIFRSRGSRLRT